MLRISSGRLVEYDGRQAARFDISKQIFAILQMALAIDRTGGKLPEIVEGLMVGLEIQRAVLFGVNDRPFLARGASPVVERGIPSARIPSPADALGGQRIA